MSGKEIVKRWIVYNDDGIPAFHSASMKACASFVQNQKIRNPRKKNSGYIFKYDLLTPEQLDSEPAELTGRQVRMRESCVDTILRRSGQAL